MNYFSFIIAGVFAFQWAVDYRVHKLRERNNVGKVKQEEDYSVFGQRPSEE